LIKTTKFTCMESNSY